MGRTLRANLPGVPFHLTSRVQGHRPLFVGLEQRIIEIVQQSVVESHMRLLAVAVMPNHLHLALVQGILPLACCMQPLLRRVALLVSKLKKQEGHIFERRYNDRACLDPFYLRNVIAYLHLNPVRAKLCKDPSAYAWTSHNAYCGNQQLSKPFSTSMESGLRLFAAAGENTPAEWRASYLGFLRWRQDVDLLLESEISESTPEIARRPWNPDGDAHWWREFGDSSIAAHVRLNCSPDAALRPDLRALALAVLQAEAPDMPLSLARSSARTPTLVRVRRLIAERALMAGHAVHQIARFLRVSHTTVSRVASERRAAAPAERAALTR